MKIEIRRTNNGQFYWRIVAGNGEPLAHSETYIHKSDAVSAAQSVKTNAAGAPILDLA